MKTVKGWIDRRLVDVTGETTNMRINGTDDYRGDYPIADADRNRDAPPPTATDAPPPSNVWRASYFDNRNLQGQPVVVQEATTINFIWGANPPVAQLPADSFSARFERVVDFNEGFYRFSINADDGVRFWIDGKFVLDEWHG